MADILLGNVKGPQGNTGATGSQGPQGDAATITVGTVSTTAYGNTASVTNSGTEQDAVLDFVIPQGKPGEQTTRMGALTLDTITAQSADFPIPAVGETGSTVFGKIIKFFNSTISALNSKLNISDVVNNLTSTSTTQPLSAAQGKALNDAIVYSVHGTVANATYLLASASFRREGRICTFDYAGGTKDISATSGYIELFRISEAYTPNESIVFSEIGLTNNSVLVFQITTAGIVNLYVPANISNGTQFRIHRSWASK